MRRALATAFARARDQDVRTWVTESTHRMDSVGVRLYAGAIAYRTIFSLLAFMSTVVLVAHLAGIEATEVRAGDSSSSGVDDLGEIARERAARTLELGSQSAVTAGVIGVLLGLYGMAGGFAAICEVLDRVHGTHTYRRLTLRYLRGAGVALVFIVLALIVIGALILTTSFGTYVLELLHLSLLEGPMRLLIGFVVPLFVLVLAFGFVLRYGSHARPPWSEVGVGAAVDGLAAYLLFWGFFGFYAIVQPFEAYGALAMAVALLLFGYWQAYLLILVAMFAPELVFVATIGHRKYRERQEALIAERDSSKDRGITDG